MKVTIAATQMSITWDIENNIKKADKTIEDSAKAGANIILLQELFEAPCFCQKENYDYFKLAKEFKDNPLIHHFSLIAKKNDVVLPISFFERAGNVFYNSLAMIDADGTVLGLYRKSHIPTGECYEEKFYFTPGDTGFKVFKTKYGRIGAGIFWDQWFPETASILALKGAEILFYPTAIGSEPVLPKDSKDHWQNTMCGHAAVKIMPVVASNRIGTETEGVSSMTFFGSSFIANEEGNKVEEMNRTDEGFILHTFDLDEIEKKRYSWGVCRDRRCDLYTPILKHNNNN
jgi:N-carbamoylputrescine amidase